MSHRLTITDTLDIPRPRPGRREARLQTGFCRRTTATGLRDETAFPKVSAMKTQLFTWSHPKTTHARPPDPARLLRRVLLGTLRSLTRIQPVLITLGNIQGTRAPESVGSTAILISCPCLPSRQPARSQPQTCKRPPEPSRRQGYARQALALEAGKPLHICPGSLDLGLADSQLVGQSAVRSPLRARSSGMVDTANAVLSLNSSLAYEPDFL